MLYTLIFQLAYLRFQQFEACFLMYLLFYQNLQRSHMTFKMLTIWKTKIVIRKAGNISIKFIDYTKKQYATVNLVNTQIYCTKLQCKCLCTGKIIFTSPLYLQAINYTISQLYYTYRLSTMFFIVTMGHWQPRTQTACVFTYCIQAYTGKIFFMHFKEPYKI